MKVFITGGSGFVGSSLTEGLLGMGASVTILTRRIRPEKTLPEGASWLEGDPAKEGSWQQALADHDVILNMAGESIFQRWSKDVKRRLYDSRILTTRNITNALKRFPGAERTLISTSAVGYYGFRDGEPLDETSSPGDDFLARLARDWEVEALEAAQKDVRVIICRFGIVLGRQGGALAEMLPIFRKGLGSPLGSGRQWVSWIHEQDLVNIYLFLLKQGGFSGTVNCTAPEPVTNQELTQKLADMLDKRAFMPHVPAFLLKLKMGEMATILLNGQRVFPKRLLDLGFTFEYPTLESALKDLLS